MANAYEMGEIEKSASHGFSAPEIEKSVLGCFLSAWGKHKERIGELREDDFYAAMHKTIFRAIKHIAAKNMDVDLITADQAISELEGNVAGYPQVLAECSSVGYTMEWNISSHVRILKELTARREAIANLDAIRQSLADPKTELSVVAEKMRTTTANMAVGHHTWMTMQDVLLHTYTNLEDRVNGLIKPITTGINQIDRMIGGFFPTELTVIGARPGIGKSLFAMNVALAAARDGKKVCICSREMTDVQYGQRILSHESNMDGMKIRKAEVDADDWAALADGMVMASNLPIEFVFSLQNVEDLRMEVQKKATKGDIDMLIVDYLQLMGTRQKYENENLRVAYMSRCMKSLAVDFNIPVIALSQVKRYAGGGRSKMPTLEDLRDSGAIEQDADGVFFLHNPESADDESVLSRDRECFSAYADSGFTYQVICVAKQRQGTLGHTAVLLSKKTMQYTEIYRDCV